MKKFLLSILLVLVLATSSFATDYYAGHVGNVSDDDVWFTTSSGSCTGTTGVSGATALQVGNTLYANGCVNLVISASFTATAISNGAGAGTIGGNFTVATSDPQKVITANVVTGDVVCLTVTGNANINPSLTIAGTITGGTGAGDYGVDIGHTAGTVLIQGNITGGANATGYGIYLGGSANLNITGSSTAVTGPGIVNPHATATINITGNCTGGTGGSAIGCSSTGAGGITVQGSIISGTRQVGAAGAITWAPSDATKYVQFIGGTDVYASAGLASDSGGTAITAANTAAKVAVGTYFVKKDDGVLTQGTATAGGGGAWGF